MWIFHKRNSVTKYTTIRVMLAWLVLVGYISTCFAVQLKCLNLSEYKFDDIIATSQPLSKFGFGPTFPHAYDKNGDKRSSPHMWASSNVTYSCSFLMFGYKITADGKIFKRGSEDQVLFEDSTMCGPYGPVYTPQMFRSWNDLIKAEPKEDTSSTRKLSMVMPLRMQWDDCFNHMSFQMMPLAGAVLEFHGELWNQLVWHTSMYSAAMINAMGIPMRKIVVEQAVEADTILLPWIPHWLPVQLAPVRGIAKRACELFTNNLLNKKFPPSEEVLHPLPVHSPTHPLESADDIINSYDNFDGMRYLVYTSRAGQSCRDVYNEETLLSMLAKVLDTKKVKLVVVGHSDAYNSITMLQRSWQRFARIFSRAIVMMGPHGGGWNNIMFTPSDCHYVEFNYFPDDPVYVPNTIQVRQPFLNAAWAKGGTGKFYNLEANNRNNTQRPHFYEAGWMKLSLRDVMRVMLLINADIPNGGILRPNVSAESYPDYLASDLKAKYRKDKRMLPRRSKAPTAAPVVEPASEKKGRDKSRMTSRTASHEEMQALRSGAMPKVKPRPPKSARIKKGFSESTTVSNNQ